MDGPNPLRPYYVPPSVGFSPAPSGEGISSKNVSPASIASNSFGSSARNILADMDYSDYLSDSSPSVGVVFKGLFEKALWRYTSVFLAQPFDVAKTILQVHDANSNPRRGDQSNFADDSRRRTKTYRTESFEISSDDSDPESVSYFTSAVPPSHMPSRPSRPRRRRRSSDSYSRSPSKLSKAAHTLHLRSNSSLVGVFSSIWDIEGSWGIWKGTNSTYVYSIMLSTITSFARSFLSAIFALPDPGISTQLSSALTYAGGLDVLSSPFPLASLAVAVSAAGVAGILLAPLDIARTKLMITPSTNPPQSVITILKSLSSWTVPFSIAPVTMLYAALPTFVSVSTPLFLRSNLGVDPVLTPNLYAISTFISQTLELGLKIPVETILRRGQLHVASITTKSRDFQTVVAVGPYKGIIGTIKHVVFEEGEREIMMTTPRSSKGPKGSKIGQTNLKGQKRKGQGYEGLYRGWRVGMWGLLGVWGAAMLGGVGAKGGEF